MRVLFAIFVRNFITTVRHKGNENEYKKQQDGEVMDAYRRIFNMYGGEVSVCGLYELTAFSPSSRFFVDTTQALRVVRVMRSGKPLRLMRECRMRMYYEIYRRTKDVLIENNGMLLSDAVAKVVEAPAPEMYLSPRQVSAIINKEKKRCFETRKQRYLRSRSRS